jgi:hypothetical protein
MKQLIVVLSAGLVCCCALAYSDDPGKTKADSGKKAEAKTFSIRGSVAWFSEALERKHGVKQVPEAAERVLALEATSGELHPLIEDTRGRGFRADPRLRGVNVELLVRQHPGIPFVQVLRVFELRADGKYELDYWCDICSIVMYELKECECCQGMIELRKTKAEE